MAQAAAVLQGDFHRAQFGRAVGSTGHAGQFFGQNVVEDEIAARIGGDQLQTRIGQQAAEIGGGMV